MNVILIPLLEVLEALLHFYSLTVIAAVIVRWLILFNVLNTRQTFVHAVSDTLFRLTDPPLSFIRQRLPFIVGIDLSPLLLLLVLFFMRSVLQRLIVTLS